MIRQLFISLTLVATLAAAGFAQSASSSHSTGRIPPEKIPQLSTRQSHSSKAGLTGEFGSGGQVPSDNLFLRQALISSTGSNESLGYSVVVQGNVMVIGAPTAYAGLGRITMCTRANSNWASAWSCPTQSNGSNIGDGFGASVAFDGATLVVGAPGTTVGSDTGQGAIYLYEYNGTNWQPLIGILGDSGAGNGFGGSVAVSGNYMIVGADGYGTNDEGRAYIYEKSGGTWNSTPVMTMTGTSANDHFGSVVVMSGSYAGAGGSDIDVGGTDNGQINIYTLSGSTWNYIDAYHGIQSGSRLGPTVMTSDGKIIFGLPGWSSGQGIVSTWSCPAPCSSPAGFSWTGDISNPSGTNSGNFGTAVSFDGSTYALSAPGISSGKVYLFSNVNGPFRDLGPDSGATGVLFGSAVSINAGVLAVGMPTANEVPFHVTESSFGGSNDGVVYVFQDYTTTAAGAVVSGRVKTAGGAGLKNAKVTLTDSQGTARTASTGSFGAFRFENIPVGQDYVLTVGSKRYRFSPQTISLTADLTGLEISAGR